MGYELKGKIVKITDEDAIRHYLYNDEISNREDIINGYIEDGEIIRYENDTYIQYYTNGVFPHRIGGPAVEYKNDVLKKNNEYYINGTSYFIGDYINRCFRYELDADQIISLTGYVAKYMEKEKDFASYEWESLITLYKDIGFKSPYRFNCIKIVKMIQDRFDGKDIEAGYYYDNDNYDRSLIKPSKAGRVQNNPYLSEEDKKEILKACSIDGTNYDEELVKVMEIGKMSNLGGENKDKIIDIKNCFKFGLNEEIFRDLSNL